MPELPIPIGVVGVTVLVTIAWVAIQRRRSADAFRARYFKIVAVALLAIPALLLATLAIGEMAGGDVAGVQHVPEALALAALAAAAWKYPRRVGAILVVASVALLALWSALALTADRHDSPATMVLVAAMLFLPPLVAGLLLYADGKRRA